MQVISIQQLEATINKVRTAAPPVNGVLSPALCVFAEIYGNMIYTRAREIDIDALAADARCIVREWIAHTTSVDSIANSVGVGGPRIGDGLLPNAAGQC